MPVNLNISLGAQTQGAANTLKESVGGTVFYDWAGESQISNGITLPRVPYPVTHYSRGPSTVLRAHGVVDDVLKWSTEDTDVDQFIFEDFAIRKTGANLGRLIYHERDEEGGLLRQRFTNGLFRNLSLSVPTTFTDTLMEIQGNLSTRYERIRVHGGTSESLGLRLSGTYMVIDGVYQPVKDGGPGKLMHISGSHNVIKNVKNEGLSGAFEIYVNGGSNNLLENISSEGNSSPIQILIEDCPGFRLIGGTFGTQNDMEGAIGVKIINSPGGTIIGTQFTARRGLGSIEHGRCLWVDAASGAGLKIINARVVKNDFQDGTGIPRAEEVYNQSATPINITYQEEDNGTLLLNT